MWSESLEAKKLIREFSRETVLQLAPEEGDFFEELMEEYFENPKAHTQPQGVEDDPLGSGLADSMIVITPVIASMSQAVLDYIMTEIIKASKEEGAASIKNTIHALFNPQKAKEGSAPLTREQLKVIKKKARDQARQFGLNNEKAEKMVNALIGSLALSK